LLLLIFGVAWSTLSNPPISDYLPSNVNGIDFTKVEPTPHDAEIARNTDVMLLPSVRWARRCSSVLTHYSWALTVLTFFLDPGPWAHPTWKHVSIFFIYVPQKNMGYPASPERTRSDGLCMGIYVPKPPVR
jgi:hypothetical protein